MGEIKIRDVLEWLENKALLTIDEIIPIAGGQICQDLDVYVMVNYMLRISRGIIPLWEAVRGEKVDRKSLYTSAEQQLKEFMERNGIRITLLCNHNSAIGDAFMEVVKGKKRFYLNFVLVKEGK